MSTAPPDPVPAEPSPTPARPKRSPVERALVWGFIGVMGIVVLIEGMSYLAFRRAHAAMLAELQKAETTDYRVTAARVKEIVGDRAPDISKKVKAVVGEEQYDVYIYKGLLKERPLCVHYSIEAASGEEPEVMGVDSIIPDELF